MSKLIDYLEALGRISSKCQHIEENDTEYKKLYIHAYNQGLESAQEVIMDMVQNDSQWIDVDDRLPKESGEYIVTKHFEYYGLDDMVCMSMFANGQFVEFTQTGKVIAWMEKPKVYRKKVNDGDN